MARYIDAEALIEQMEADAEHIDNYIVKMALYVSIYDVKNAPTADVVERKKGEWKFDNSCAYIERYICSSCRESYKVDTFMGEPMWNYCPNCGSDMRKGKKKDDRA